MLRNKEIHLVDIVSMPKITDVLNRLSPNDYYFSYEFFPPKTHNGMKNLTARLERMATLGPAFVTITWGAGGSTVEKTIQLAQLCQRELRLTTCMHLTCTNMRRQVIDEALDEAKKIGIRNILALRGDPPRGEEYWTPVDSQFCHAADLVRYIRKRHGDYFCIGVASYPEGHIEGSGSISERDPKIDLEYLVEKVQAGADFIITQMFYDVNKFLEFDRLIKSHPSGAFKNIPILPGLMCLNTYQSFIRAVKFSHASIPESMQQELNKITVGDDEAIKQFGIKWLCQIIKEIKEKTSVKGLHFYTLNLEKSVALVLEQSGLIRSPSAKYISESIMNSDDDDRDDACSRLVLKSSNSNTFSRRKRRTSSMAKNRIIVPHSEENDNVEDSDVVSETEASRNLVDNKNEVVFSISNVEGALGREATWDDFPNGRFGDSRSPAYGYDTGYGNTLHVDKTTALKLWGYPVNVNDISSLFIKHLTSELDTLPFSDQGLSPETALIQEELLRLNNKGYWTVASQPAGNSIRSDDKIYGWGPPGGYVFQKAFVEIFVSDDDWKILENKLANSLELSYYEASNISGAQFSTNLEKGASSAVTWGVFPNREIIQSTIIEEESFLAWKEESFSIWKQWMYLYNTQSVSFKLLEHIYNTYHLVTVVHHDYFHESALWDILINV